MKSPEPKLIVIAGSVGSGKSTIAARLSTLLGGAPVLAFDDYEKYVEWPENMAQWMQDGADPTGIRAPRLKKDLMALLNGRPIVYPSGNLVVAPESWIILEEPSGRERAELRELIDRVIYLDVPPDVCVLRIFQRVIDMNVWNSKGTFTNESKEDLVRQLDAAAMWAAQYQRARSMYLDVSRAVKRSADILVDGLLPVDEIAADLAALITSS